MTHKTRLQAAVVGFALLAPLSGYSQSLLPALSALVKPNQYMHEGRLVSCGITVTILAGLTPDSLDVTTLSLHAVFPSSQKVAGIVSFASESMLKAQSTIAPKGIIESAWLRTAENDALQLGKLTQEKNGSVSAVADMSKTILAIVDIVENGARVQTGIRLKGASSELIYSGTPTLSEPDKLASRACIKEWINRVALAPD